MEPTNESVGLKNAEVGVAVSEQEVLQHIRRKVVRGGDNERSVSSLLFNREQNPARVWRPEVPEEARLGPVEVAAWFEALSPKEMADWQAVMEGLRNNTLPQYSPEMRRVSCGYLILDRFASALRDKAVEAFECGDPDGLLGLADNMRGLGIVEDNAAALVARGICERALLIAYTSPRTNTAGWSIRRIRALFSMADAAQLRDAGDPLPGTGPFTLHRGIAGIGSRRRVRGLSWTSDEEEARWFAVEFAGRFGLGNPAIVSGVFAEPEILAYTNEREEHEFLVSVPTRTKLSVEKL